MAAGDIVQSVVEGSGQVFLYDQEYSLTQEEVGSWSYSKEALIRDSM